MNAVLGNKTILQQLNIGLGIILIISVIFFISAHINNAAFINQSNTAHTDEAARFQSMLSLKPIAEYTRIVSSRELFRPFVFQSKKSMAVKTIDDVTRDMMLVGVVSVGEKEAIIKNRRTRQTYFVTEGTQLGELKVIGIYDDKIELAYKNERKELFLR